jgi:autophagy-related protein 5
VPEIKRFLQDVVFDDEAARLMKEEEWWFESEEGHLLKWWVPPNHSREALIFLTEVAGTGPSGSFTTTMPP